MAKWVPRTSVPAGLESAAQGFFQTTEATAIADAISARLALSAAVNEAIEGAASGALRRIESLRERVSRMVRPKVFYTTSDAVEQDGSWRIPFDVYIVDAGPKPIA